MADERVGKAKKTEIVRIYNCSPQLIQLQVRPPGSDFYRNEQQARIGPGRDVLLPKSHLMPEQISNLQKRGMIKVIYDSEAKATVTP
jgi:hypothetical protein